MKKHFLTGLALLLPAVLTAMIFIFMVNLLTKPFVGTFEEVFAYYGLLDKQYIRLFSRFLILIGMMGITLLIGFLTRLFIFRYFLKVGHYFLERIPLVNKIYTALQEVTATIFQSDAPTFSQVVLIPFPDPDNLSIGLVTNDPQSDQMPEDLLGNISVFVPATPNPTMGFMLLFKREQLIVLDMKVDEAIQFIISCGVMGPNLGKRLDAEDPN